MHVQGMQRERKGGGARGEGGGERRGEKGRRRVATHKHRYTDTQIHAARVVEHQIPCHERAAMEIGREHKRV